MKQHGVTPRPKGAAMQFHPDRNPGDEAAINSFKRIQEAYNTLSDSNNRARYDGTNQNHTKTYKPKDKKGKRPYAGDGFIFRDAPPPKVDIWGEPIVPEHKWTDAFSDHYETEGQPDIRE